MDSNDELIQKVIAEATGRYLEQISIDAGLISDLHVDDLDLLEIALGLEDEFNIEINDSDTDGWVTVSDVIRCVKDKLATS